MGDKRKERTAAYEQAESEFLKRRLAMTRNEILIERPQNKKEQRNFDSLVKNGILVEATGIDDNS